jgi:hypothetical protein
MPEFSIVLDGLELDARQEKQLREALQRVVLEHVASWDTGGDRGAPVLALLAGNGSTQGATCRLLDPDALHQVFPSLK